MTCTTASVLIDTNVLVYACDGSAPEKQSLALAVTDALSDRGVGRISTQVVGEFYSAVTRKSHLALSREVAARLARDLLMAWPTFVVTPEIAFQALDLAVTAGLGVWDAQLLATASAYRVPFVLSEDLQNGRDYGGVTIVDPFAEGFTLESLTA